MNDSLKEGAKGGTGNLYLQGAINTIHFLEPVSLQGKHFLSLYLIATT